jgi:peptide/nickel transport system substrate-binding protein
MKLLNSTARASSAVLAGALLLGSLTACGGGSSQATAKADTSSLTPSGSSSRASTRA